MTIDPMLDHFTKILVTGGCGFIGTHLVRHLLSAGNDVTIIDNLSTPANNEIPQGAKLFVHDIRDAVGLAEIMKGAQLVFHLAGNSNGTFSVQHPELDFAVNACGTKHILDAACSANVKRLVYLSSAAVYGKPTRLPIKETDPTNPFLPYGRSKLKGEWHCREIFESHGLPIIIARPFCVYGCGENPKTALVEVSRYLRWHLNDRPIQVVGNSKRKTRDFVHVDDVVSALVSLADHASPGEVYNIGTGREVSMFELVYLITTLTSREARVIEISDIQNDTYRLVPDISKMMALGYVPQMSLADGIKRLINYLGEQPDLPNGMTIFHEGQVAETDY